MTTIKFILIFLSIALYSCGQKNTKTKVDQTAVNINNSAMTMVKYLKNADSSQKAIELLDSATTLDTNYYLGYFNKLMFLNNLKQFDKAILTTQNLIRLRPDAHDLYIIGGVFCEKNSDTISSKGYFQKSLAICNVVLDTMSFKNSDYEMIMTNKAVNLIMLNRNAEANTVLKKLGETQSDGEMKNITLSMMGLNKNQLIEMYYSDKNSR
jgi:tetratricopeptide (TPR) repeat protein